VGPKSKDAGDGSNGGGEDAVVACAGASFDTGPIYKDQEGHDEVFGVRNRVDKDGGVIGKGVVGDL